MAFARESSRFYDPVTAQVVETILGVNGRQRPPNKRDAAARGLLESVSSYLKRLDKPGLNKWLQKQMMLACLTTTRKEGESDADFIERIESDAGQQSKDAADRGKRVHTAIQRHLQGELYDSAYKPHVEAVEARLAADGVNLREGVSERSFASVTLGWAGTPDWRDATTVLDFKTRETLEPNRKAYPEQALQLVGYALGLGIEQPRCGNVFVGVEPAQCQVFWWTPEQIADAGQAFQHLVSMSKAMGRL